MTFPQTSSIDAATGGQEYWRLITQPETSGDIWESDTGARAFLIGPQSDIARVLVTYLDPVEPDSTNEVEVSTTKPLVGRLDARMNEEYPTRLPGDVQLPGRLLITLKDLMPPLGWAPATADETTYVNVTQPILDLFQYLSNEPTYFGARSDKIYNYTFGKGAFSGKTAIWFAVPFYGRRLAQVTVGAASGTATTGAVTIYGVNFSSVLDTGLGAINETINPMIQLDTDNGSTPNTAVSSVDEPFDYLVVKLEPADADVPYAIKILVSDQLG